MDLVSERPRRIVLVEGNRDGTVGGSFQCLHDIARFIDRSRYEPVAVFWDANRFADRLRAEGIEVHLWRQLSPDDARPGSGSPFARVSRAIRRIATRRRFLRRVRASLVHLNNTPETGFDDWLPAARLLGLPIVAHARMAASTRIGTVRRRLIGRFDRVIAISDYVAATFRDVGVPASRLVRIHDGIDIESVRAEGARPAGETRAALGVPADGWLIVMAGNLKRWKGQHVLLDALSRLAPATRRRCHVAFAGAVPADSGAYEAELRSQVERSGLAEQVRFLGARDDVPALMNAADIVVHASTRPEPFGLVVVEAMALGRPLVASDRGGPAETVAPGTGLLFDTARPDALAERLQQLLEDEPFRCGLGKRARVRAEEFSIQRNVAAIEALYADLLGAASGRADRT